MGQSVSRTIVLADAMATEMLGAAIGRCLLPLTRPRLLGLYGPLGAGKTTFARGLLRALGVGGRVPSPTYTLLETYETDAGSVHHLDLYRFSEPGEFEFLGLTDVLDQPGLVMIEWPEKGPAALADKLHLKIDFAYVDEGRKADIGGGDASFIDCVARTMTLRSATL